MSMLKKIHGCSRLYKVLGIQKKLCQTCPKPQHLICFRFDWTPEKILNVINSALTLKKEFPTTRLKKLDILKNHKIMILSEVNEPTLISSVTRAALFLGAQTVNISDKLLWDHDYNGRIFSFMAEAIFCSTASHGCVSRMADMSLVPVICMKSRTNAALQALGIMMTIMEEFGQLRCINIAYIGPPQPILNTLLLLAVMLGANIRVKCCSKNKPTSPLLLHVAQNYASHTGTLVKMCATADEALEFANVIIAGPTAGKSKKHIYHFDLTNIANSTRCRWMFIHCCPRGKEVNDMIFYGKCARTFNLFYNLQYIAAALMVFTLKNHFFCGSSCCC